MKKLKEIIATCIVRQKLSKCKNKKTFTSLKKKLSKEYCIMSTTGSCFCCPYLTLKKQNGK